MKHHLLILSSCLLLSTTVQAESPIQSGDLDLMVVPIGITAAGMRYAVNDKVAIYGLLDNFTRIEDKNTSYSTVSEEYEDYSTEIYPEFIFKAGMQYFFVDGAYVSGDVGYYSRNNTEDFESAANDDEETTVSTIYGNASVGFEHPLGERLAIHAAMGLEVGRRSSEYTEIDSNGDQTDGSKTDRTYMNTHINMGFSYTLN